MTAVASPPTLSQHSRPAWGMNGHRGIQSVDAMNPDELNRMFMPRKSSQRNNSSSSISSNSSNSSTSTVVGPNGQPPQQNGTTNGAPLSIAGAGDLGSWVQPAPRKRLQQTKGPWQPAKPEAQSDFARMAAGRPQLMGMNGSGPMQPAPILQSQQQMPTQQGIARPLGEGMPQGAQPMLYLLSLNGTFERKTISVPFSPDTLRIGRQTNAKTVPTSTNGFFDSKVLSRQHAEIWADRQGKVWIRDVKSSNGTFVNGTRLSQENRESEPHELQTGDHLELGIDIVSEDQKTVVHHKVAAKVEHAGFLNNSSNLLDMNFGDLDPSNSMMMQHAGGVPFRGRTGSQASLASNGRVMPNNAMVGAQVNGIPQPRAGGFFFSPISTEQIVKKLQNEMRSARLQNQDLGRTGHFISTLLSKDDIKDMEKLEGSDGTKHQAVNGNAAQFMRADNKARFSDPPAPPPQQPLPEKPDVPSLKRGITERPKTSVSSANVSPIRQDGNVSQILQLTEALTSAKKELESQSTRMRDLEDMLHKERHARELAEELARRLEDAAAAKVNGVSHNSEQGIAEPTLVLDEAFEPPVESSASEADTSSSSVSETATGPEVENIEASATQLHKQLESMVLEMKELKQQLEIYKTRAESAEAERDTDRKTLAEMALQIRKDAEMREESVRWRSLSEKPQANGEKPGDEAPAAHATSTKSGTKGSQSHPDESDGFTLSRADTIRPYTTQGGQLAHNQALANSLPYASMMGVVLLGMGLMAYINGWQPQPPRLER